MVERVINGVPHLLHEHGAFPLILPPDALSDSEYDFRKGELLYTRYRGVLPAPSFSKERFKALQALAQREGSFEALSEAYAVARALLFRERAKPVSFEEEMGCWLLPLKAERDTEGRARYPALDARASGVTRALAHQLTYPHLRNIKLPRISMKNGEIEQSMPIDHLCHNHACCNPYHLEAVSVQVNSQRGRTVRDAKINQTFYQIEPGVLPYEELRQYLEQFRVFIPSSIDIPKGASSVGMGQAAILGTIGLTTTEYDPHPMLFTDELEVEKVAKE